METKEMTCINCPIGCSLTVNINESEIIVSGNNCPRGEVYAKAEVTNPTRIVTSTIKVEGGKRVSCKTKNPIPKGMIFEVMEKIKQTRLKAPINIGDVLITNVCNTGVDVVATKNIK